MKGSIHLRRDTRHPWWYVMFYWDGAHRKISKYRGHRMHQTHPDQRWDRGYDAAQKLLAQIQGDVERGVFRLEKYQDAAWTDVLEFLAKWLDKKAEKAPATYKGYASYHRCHFVPFFRAHKIMLHEITAGTMEDLKDSLVQVATRGGDEKPLSAKGKFNVICAFHEFLDYAHRHGKIAALPPFPRKSDYNLTAPIIEWLPETRQMAVIEAIPAEHRPIFEWLKYHYRRPSEACALHKIDFDPFAGAFIIRRAVSAREVIDRTKTGAVHHVPCADEFIDTARRLLKENTECPFLFVNPRARKSGRYTLESLAVIWRAACAAAGESIGLYAGLKHSACSQFINERGGSVDELQMLTDHARRESVLRYAAVELSRKRALMNKGRVVAFKKRENE